MPGLEECGLIPATKKILKRMQIDANVYDNDDLSMTRGEHLAMLERGLKKLISNVSR